MKWKNYLEYKIVRGIRSSTKTINKLKPGDRFIYLDKPLLMFTNIKNADNMLLGISDLGTHVWFKEHEEILHVHAVSIEFSLISSLVRNDVVQNGYLKFMAWEGIKSMIIRYLIDNPNRILTSP